MGGENYEYLGPGSHTQRPKRVELEHETEQLSIWRKGRALAIRAFRAMILDIQPPAQRGSDDERRR